MRLARRLTPQFRSGETDSRAPYGLSIRPQNAGAERRCGSELEEDLAVGIGFENPERIHHGCSEGSGNRFDPTHTTRIRGAIAVRKGADLASQQPGNSRGHSRGHAFVMRPVAVRRAEVAGLETVWVPADDRQRSPAESTARPIRNAAVISGTIGLYGRLTKAREAFLMRLTR